MSRPARDQPQARSERRGGWTFFNSSERAQPLQLVCDTAAPHAAPQSQGDCVTQPKVGGAPRRLPWVTRQKAGESSRDSGRSGCHGAAPGFTESWGTGSCRPMVLLSMILCRLPRWAGDAAPARCRPEAAVFGGGPHSLAPTVALLTRRPWAERRSPGQARSSPRQLHRRGGCASPSGAFHRGVRVVAGPEKRWRATAVQDC